MSCKWLNRGGYDILKKSTWFAILVVIMGILNISAMEVSSQPISEKSSVYGYVHNYYNSSEPIKGVGINLTFDDNDTFIGTFYTNATGGYEITNLAEGNYTIELKKKYYEDINSSFMLESNQTKHLDFALMPLDTDSDGVFDEKDDFPTDPGEFLDSDGDGHGDNGDAYPFDPTRWEKTSPGPNGGGDANKKEDVDMSEGMKSSALICIPILVIGLIVIVLMVVGYTRLKSRRLLEHQTRNRIYEHVRANPGVHYRGIMNELDLAMGVLTHHLNMLERQGFIKSLQDGSYRRFYTQDTKIDTNLLLTDPQQQILDTIKYNPGISQTQLAENLNMTKKTVYYNVSQLRDAGLVFVDKTGRESECFYAGET